MPDIKKYLSKDGLEDYNELLPHSATQMQEYVSDWLDAHPEATTTIEDGAVTTAKIADGAITDEKLVQVGGVFSKVSSLMNTQNIFDPNTVVFGSYINVSGSTSTDGNYSHSAPMDVVPGLQYTYKIYPSKFGTNAAKTAVFYDENSNIITVVGTVSGNLVTVTAPNEAAQLVVNVKNSDIQTFMVCVGTTMPDIYIPTNIVQLKENVRPQNIEVKETTFIDEQSLLNYYNPNDSEIVAGKDLTNNGTFVDNPNMNVSGFIECIEGATYTFPVYTTHFGTGSNAKYVVCYNADKTFIKSVLGTLNGPFLTFTVAPGYGIRYFRVNVTNSDANSNYIQTPYHSKSCFMVINDNSMPNRFYPYIPQYEIDTNIYSEHENLFNPLYGKKVAFLGDSICEGDSAGGWASRIGIANTMLWENYGIGGSTISTAMASKTICTRAVTMTDPDFIILEGGTNDADRIGNATGEVKPANFGVWSENNYGTNDSSTYYGFDINTFCGAVDYMCKRFVSEYPSAKIGFIGAQKMGTVDTTRENRGYYIKTAMEICKKWGISCLNLWDTCHLNPLIPSHYTSGEDYMYIDGQHLTSKGYEYITAIINAWMKTL